MLVRAKATFLGHPIHPMLIVFPLGLLTVAAIFDIIYVATHNGHWADVSYWMIAAGTIGGLIAAVFGLIDWFEWDKLSATPHSKVSAITRNGRR